MCSTSPGGFQSNVYSPASAIVSLLYVLDTGASAEIAIVGNEGLVGISQFMGCDAPRRSTLRCRRRPCATGITRLISSFAGGSLSLDRLQGDKLIMTQELIANMLGVRREGVTEAASKLQRAGLIQYVRGHITVLDRPRLEQRSCECYAVVKKEYDRLLPDRKAV
jgi:DNA-binding transcriptional regulator YhcF (GntR family)